MTQLDPIVNQPNLYVQGLSIGQGSTTTWTIFSGAARDSTNTNDLMLSNPVTLSSLTNGLNALDTGTIAPSTFYALFVIGDSSNKQPTGGLISLSATAPVLPFGYDMLRRVGWGYTTSGSLTTALWQTGAGSSRTYYYNTTFPVVLTAGVATTFTTVSTAGAVPISNQQSSAEGLFKLTYVSASAANTVDFGVPGTPQPIFSVSNGAAATTISTIWLLTKSSSIVYRTTSASDSVSMVCTGFRDYL